MANELIEIEEKKVLVAFTDDGIDPYIKQAKELVDNFNYDLSTGVSRAKIASLASKVSKFKVKLDGVGKGLVAEWKVKSVAVDKSRRKMRDDLDDLRDLARKPLTDWENEQKVIAAEKLAKEEAEKKQAQVDADHELAIEQYKNHLREVADKKIVDALGAEKLLEQKRQEQIAHDKDVAETARIKAEQEAEDKIAAVEKEKQDAIDLTAKLKQDAINAKAIAKQAKINADDLLILNDAHRDNAAFDAEKARLYGIEQARLNEIQRKKDEQARIQKEADDRESDKKHKGKIHRDILKVLKDNGIGEEDGKTMIKLACKRLLPNLSINY